MERSIAPWKQRASVVWAGAGQSLTLTFVTTFLLLYLTEYVHISSEGMLIVTAILTATKIFDALSDPFMGSIVDKTRTRWGKLRPYILFSAAPVALLSILLFSIPNIEEGYKLIFFGVVYFLWGIAYTMCDVPYWGLIGAVFTERKERTGVISSVRAVMALITGLVTLSAPWLAKLLSFAPETTASGWSRVAILLCVPGMALFTLAFWGTREKPKQQEQAAVSFKMLFSALFRNKPLFLVLIGSIIGFGRTIIQAGGAVFAIIAYDNEGYFTLIGGAIIAGLVLSSALAPLLLKRMSDRTAIILSSLLGAVFNAAMYFVGFENLYAMMGFIFLTGLTLGLFMVVQTTMIAGAVDYIERKTGVRNDGISFSSLTFVSKIMGSLSVLVFGLVISSVGYESGVTVTADMQNSVFFAITIIPAISCLLSAIPFAFYNVSNDNTNLK